MKKLPGPNPRRMSLLAIALLAAAPAPAQQRAERPAYRNPAAPLEQRVEDLLARMTQEEKIAQITTIWTQKKQLFDSAGRFDPAAARRLYPSGIGQFARPSDLQGPGSPFKTPYRDVRQTIELVNAIQRYASSTRLGIPVLFHEEGLHGYAARGATHFPQAIALASSWDPALLERVFTVVAREIRARGVQLVLAPVVDVGRDPRWGRIEETYGEDPVPRRRARRCSRAGFSGSQSAARTGSSARDAEAHDRPRPARERHQRRARQHLRARPARGLLPAVPRRGGARQRAGSDAFVQRDRRRAFARRTAGCCTTCCAAKWASKARSSATTSRSRS